MDPDVLKYLKSVQKLKQTSPDEYGELLATVQAAQAETTGTVPTNPNVTTTTPRSTTTTTNNTINYDDQNQADFATWLESQGLLAGWINKSDPNWGMYWDSWMLGGGKEVKSIYASQEGVTDESPSEETDTTLLLSSLKSLFMSALLETGLDTETINKLWEWAEGRFTNDSSFTAAQALVEMYDQQAFKDRFPGIAHMRDLPEVRRDIPSPAEYLQREGKMKQWFNQYGLDVFAANLDSAVAESFISSACLTLST